MTMVKRKCQKCGKEFEVTVPIGMNEYDRALFEEENATCEACSFIIISPKPKGVNGKWDRNDWKPENHDKALMGTSGEKQKQHQMMPNYAYFEDE